MKVSVPERQGKCFLALILQFLARYSRGFMVVAIASLTFHSITLESTKYHEKRQFPTAQLKTATWTCPSITPAQSLSATSVSLISLRESCLNSRIHEKCRANFEQAFLWPFEAE